MANDNSIGLIGGYGYRLAKDTIGTSFHNLKDIKTMDLSQPWWPSNIAEATDIGNKIFTVRGNIDPDFYDMSWVIYFNKALAEDYQIPDLYELVKSGKWTMEQLDSVAKMGAEDLNGDTIMDENDRFGYLTNRNMEIDAFIPAFDIKITEKGSDGLPKLLGLTERYVSGWEKVRDFIHQSYVLYGPDSKVGLFMKGNGLMLSEGISQAHVLRGMDDDFGILPYPKYDEAQDRYMTYARSSTSYAIPITSDAEKVGAVLEALAYYGYQDVYPEYYERALKGKSARDNESAEMLDIIFNNVVFEFTLIYSYCFGDQKAPSMLMRMTVNSDTDIASAYAADETLYESTMQSLIKALQ